MNEGHNLIVVTFEDDSKAYEALSKLKHANTAGRVTVASAAVVRRDSDGRISVAEGADAVIGTGVAGGSLVGLLLGVFGGPVGSLFGFGTGALVGSAFDVQRADRESGVLEKIANALPLGCNALVAEVNEFAVEVVDGEMSSLGGTVTRVPAAEVLAAIESADKAAEAAEREGARVMHEERKQEVKAKFNEIEAKWDERINALKKKMGA